VPADLVDDDSPALARVARKTTPAAAVAALGIVYAISEPARSIRSKRSLVRSADIFPRKPRLALFH
jgi:hypothetical protein